MDSVVKRDRSNSVSSSDPAARANKASTRVRVVQRWKELVQPIIQNGVQVRQCWAARARDTVQGVPNLTTETNLEDEYDLTAELFGSVYAARRSLSGLPPGGLQRSLPMHSVAMTHSFLSSVLSNPMPVMAPSSRHRFVWTVLSMITMSIDMLMSTLIPFGVSSHEVEIISNSFWSMDILASFRSGFYNEGILEMRPAPVARKYLFTWFPFDVGITTWMWFVLLGEAYVPLDNVAWLRLLRYSRITRLVRLTKVFEIARRSLEEKENSSQEMYVVLKIISLVLMLILWVHSAGCVWFAIGGADSSGWSSSHTTGVFFEDYILSVHWAVANIQGSTDVRAVTPYERLCEVIVIMMSVVLLSLFLSRVTDLMVHLHQIRSHRSRLVTSLSVYLYRHNVSTDVAVQARYHCQCAATIEEANDRMDEVLRIMPKYLKIQILTEARGRKVLWHGFFAMSERISSRFTQRVLCEKIVQQTHGAEEVIFSPGELPLNVYFTDVGKIKYSRSLGSLHGDFRNLLETARLLQDQRSRSKRKYTSERKSVLNHFEQNRVGRYQCIAEPALWCQWLHAGTLQSATQSTILALDVIKFTDLATSIPRIRQLAIFYAREFVTIGRNHAAELSDVFDFTQLCSAPMGRMGYRKNWSFESEKGSEEPDDAEEEYMGESDQDEGDADVDIEEEVIL